MSSFLPEDFIEEVRVANEITDVISEYLPLKPKGKSLFGLCPFHNEKSPSFSVDPERQFYHCFGCGAGGNVFSFIMAQEKMEFVDSVKFLAQRKGISLPDSPDRAQDKKVREHKEILRRINREAAIYYHERLLSHHGQHALKYLKTRGIDHSIIRTFGLGYAPDSWDSTMNHLLNKGFSIQLLTEIGLVVEKNERTYDRFRDRIMFPIIDQRDQVVGFGGRVMGDALPKYLNSSDSLVFNKSSILFGLNLVRKRRPIDNLIVVEGYLDVISLYRFGFYNAVASLGTAMTPNQAKLMKRYTPNIFMAYDGDTSGQKASLRALDILKNVGCNVKVIKLPKGMDPDDVLRKQGIDYFNKLIKNAISLTDFKLDRLQAEYDLDNQEDRIAFATKAANILIDVDNLLERDIYIQRLNNSTGFRSELLYQFVKQLENRKDRRGLKKNIIGNNRYTTTVGKARLQVATNIKAEMHLIRLMATNENLAKRIVDQLGGLQFEESAHRIVTNIIKELLDKNIDLDQEQILSHVENEQVRAKVFEIFGLEMEYDNVDRYIEDCIEELRRSQLERQRNILMEQIREIEDNGEYDPGEYRKLVAKLSAINRMTKLGPLGKEEII